MQESKRSILRFAFGRHVPRQKKCYRHDRESLSRKADLDLAGAEVEIARMSDHLTRLAGRIVGLSRDETFDFILLVARLR